MMLNGSRRFVLVVVVVKTVAVMSGQVIGEWCIFCSVLFCLAICLAGGDRRGRGGECLRL